MIKKESSTWRQIFFTSGIYLSTKLCVGLLSFGILYNVLFEETLVLIHQIGLILQIMLFFSFGAKNRVMDGVIGGEDPLIYYSNFIFIKSAAYLVSIVILFVLYNFGFLMMNSKVFILLLALLTFSIVSDIFFTVSFAEGKLTYQVNIVTFKSIIFPIVIFFYGFEYQIFAWFSVMLFIELFQLSVLWLFVLKKTKIYSSKYFSFSKVKSILSSSYIFDINSKLELLFEVCLFFFLVTRISVFEAAALSFFYKITQTLTKTIGLTIQKKTIFNLIDLLKRHDRGQELEKEIKENIIVYLGLCFTALLSVTLIFSVVTLFFIEKFKEYHMFLSLSLILSMSRLSYLIMMRSLFTKMRQDSLKLLFIINLLFYAVTICVLWFWAKSFIDILLLITLMSISFLFFVYYFFSQDYLNHFCMSIFLALATYSIINILTCFLADANANYRVGFNSITLVFIFSSVGLLVFFLKPLSDFFKRNFFLHKIKA